jgi:hypothetical protein
MTSLQRLETQTAGSTLPRLVSGLRTPTATSYMPHRYGQHLAAWAREQGISPHADVAVTMTIQRPVSGMSNRGPLERFTRAEMEMIEPDADIPSTGGWGLEIITETERISLHLLESGQIADVLRSPHRRDSEDDARGNDPTALPPAYRLRDASTREADLKRAHEVALVARNVTIRAALAEGLSPTMAAEFTGLGDQRIYQIRDERR